MPVVSAPLCVTVAAHAASCQAKVNGTTLLDGTTPGRRTRGRVLLRLAGLAALLLTLAAGSALTVRVLTIIDRQLIYYPERELRASPADVGLAFDDVFFTASDGTRLHGWYVPGPGPATLIWFHGNGGNISHRVENLLLLNRRLGVSVFIFDYRGYGRSQGKPSEKGLYLDAESAIEYLVEDRGLEPETDLVMFGRSLGAAVAVEMAVRHPSLALVLESGFTSVRAMASRSYPWLPSGLLVRLVEARFDSLSKMPKVRAPVMVLHGDRDPLVPFEHGRELFEAANDPRRFYRIEGAAHNDTYQVGGDPYFEAMREFIVSAGGSGP